MRRVVIDEQGILPKLTLRERDVYAWMPEGAYYSVLGDKAQIIVVGPMHFSPGDYLAALNDLLDSHYEHEFNSFMEVPHDKAKQETVLSRGFVDLRFRK
jgi:hypothetical protein